MKLKEQEKGNTTDMESISSSSFSAVSLPASNPASTSVSQTPTVSTLLSIRLAHSEFHTFTTPFSHNVESLSDIICQSKAESEVLLSYVTLT